MFGPPKSREQTVVLDLGYLIMSKFRAGRQARSLLACLFLSICLLFFGQRTNARNSDNTFRYQFYNNVVLSKSNKSYNKPSKVYSTALKHQFLLNYKFNDPPYLNVQQFGAYGDGIHDDQQAISQAIAAGQALGKSIYFPPGNYLHSGLIVSNGVKLFGAGATTFLTATNNTNGAIELTGNGPSVSSMVINYLSPAPVAPYGFGWTDPMPQAGNVWIQSASNFFVTQITISNSSNNGIDLLQSSNGEVTHSIIASTSYSGMQIVDCNNVNVSNNSIPANLNGNPIDIFYGNSGSQGLTLASNSLQGGNQAIFASGLQSSYINNNNISGNTGIGIDLVGDSVGATIGEGPVSEIGIFGNTIIGTSDGAIVVNDDSNTNNFVSNNVITNNNVNGDEIDIFSGNNMVISQNSISNTANARGIGLFSPHDIVVSANTINSTQGGQDGIDSYTCQNIVIASNTISNIGGYGIYCDANINPGPGALNCSSNQLSNCCIARGNVIEFLSDGTFTSLTIASNNYAGPANLATYYIESLVAGSATNPNINGNTQATALPNHLAP